MNNTVKDIMTCINNLIEVQEQDMLKEGYSLDISKYCMEGPMNEKEQNAVLSTLLLVKDQIEMAIEENK